MIMNLCRVRLNICRYFMRPPEQCKLLRFIPNMMYSITPDKVIYCNTKALEAHHYFSYLSSINKYKPYFYNFTDEIYDIGMKQEELSPFLQELLTTLHDSDAKKVNPGKITLSESSHSKLVNGQEEWLISIRKATNQSFLKDLQFVGLLWCFNRNHLQYSVAKVIYRELEKRYFSFDTQSCLKAATFLYIFKANNMINLTNLSKLWCLIVRKLYEKVYHLSDAEIIMVIYFSGLTRSKGLAKITNDLSYRFVKTLRYLSPDEIGVIAISNFLTRNTKVTKMGFIFLSYFMVNIEHMNIMCFTSCCKYLKNIKPSLYEYELEHVYSFLMSFHQVMSSFSKVSALMHGYLFLLNHRIFTEDLIQYFNRFVLESDLTSWRSKELSYSSGIIGKMYPLFPDSHDMLSTLLNELCKEKRAEEIKTYEYQLTLALDCSSRAGYYPIKLIQYIYGEKGYRYFKDNLKENYEQHRCILNRLELDQPELFKKIPPLSHNPNNIYISPPRKISNFFEEFINVSTKEFGCKVAKTVYNFNSDNQDLELRVKHGKLIPVDEWQGLDECIKVVLVYTLNNQYHYVIDDSYNIYYELNGLISSKLRLYEKSGYTTILAKEERQISELPKYYSKLMDDIREICDNSETNDVKIHYL